MVIERLLQLTRTPRLIRSLRMEKKDIGDEENTLHRNLKRKLEGKLLFGKPSLSERMTVESF